MKKKRWITAPLVKTHRRKFMPRFHEAVRSGRKTQTIRPWPKAVPQVGDRFIAEAWTGKPYRSTVERLNEGTISAPCVMVVLSDGEMVIDGSGFLYHDEFARADGFDDSREMFAWFAENHGLPFTGCLIAWTPDKEKTK